MNLAQQAAYIAGIIDGEGHIGAHRLASGHLTRSIAFCNTDKSIIDAAVACYEALGFSVRTYFDDKKYKPNWNPRWIVYVAGGRPSFEKFKELIPIQSKPKQEALEMLLSSYVPKEETLSKIRNGDFMHCATCKKQFYASAASMERGRKFCSVECRGKSQQTLITRSCEHCGAEFLAAPSRIARGYGRFCSHSCMGKKLHAERLRAQASYAAEKRWTKNEEPN